MFPFIYLAMVVYLTVSVMYQLKHFVCLILIVLGRVSSTHQATRHRGKKNFKFDPSETVWSMRHKKFKVPQNNGS